jgi:HK97 family phage major capsid protein
VAYNDVTGRGDIRQPVEQVIADAIITALPEASLVLNAGARRVTLSRAQARLPVLSTLPEAYWVGGDTGLKQTTKETWTNKFIHVEELAVLVPIPDNVVEDADMDLFAAIQPRIVEAIGAKIDQAVLFGVSKPLTWDLGDGPTPNGLVQVCEGKGRVVQGTKPGSGNPAAGAGQMYKDIVAVTKLVAKDGHPVSTYLADTLLEYDLLGQVDSFGRPLLVASASAEGVASLLGRPFRYLNNGAWNANVVPPNPGYSLIAGDMQNLILGIRRDISWEMFREGVITDDTGKVILNLMQQDTKALRMTMRLGVTVGNPLRRRSKDDANAFPFSVLKTPSGGWF